jgi:hypothetical protein
MKNEVDSIKLERLISRLEELTKDGWIIWEAINNTYGYNNGNIYKIFAYKTFYRGASITVIMLSDITQIKIKYGKNTLIHYGENLELREAINKQGINSLNEYIDTINNEEN